MDDNGAHVTWRELHLVLEPVRSDLADIKASLVILRQTQEAQIVLGPRGRALVSYGLVRISILVGAAGSVGALIGRLIEP